MAETQAPTFDQMTYARPDLTAVRSRLTDVAARFADAGADSTEALADWQALNVDVGTMRSLAGIRFQQDTRDEARRAEKEWFDQHQPELTELYVDCARALLDGPHRGAIEAAHGTHFTALLETRCAAFDPTIKDALAASSNLVTRYQQLLAAAELEFDGKTLNLSGMVPYYESPDRDVRRAAQETTYGYFAARGEELDVIFDRLVQLRDQMGRALGHDSYVPLAYQNMTRTEYGPAEVARFRDAVREHVVPLSTELRAAQARTLGLEKLLVHDEPLRDPQGNPKPQGDDDWVVGQAREMYATLGAEFDDFFQLLDERGLADLSTRPGKSGGGFCSSLPKYKVPFIFANFNGTTGDIRVLTHECGHAFQGWKSRDLYPREYGWPTAEACEIHSMALEYLTWPQMELFFGDDADRFRREHLIGSIHFLPYACAIDEFQHWVYEHPSVTPAERKAQWLQIERKYQPARDYDGLLYASEGGLWQRQRHVYCWPFYYIDYALALTGALQFWRSAEADREGAMQTYVELCALGGSQPYLSLLESAGLDSPFEDATLAGVVQTARDWLAAHPAPQPA